MDCLRPEISERILMALYPRDFPQEQQEIQEHVQECASCRNQLDLLRSLQKAMIDRRSELADCVSDCPLPAEIVDFSLAESPDPSVMEHVVSCRACKKEVELLKELHREGAYVDDASTPSARQRAVVLDTVLREYGHAAPACTFTPLKLVRELLSALHVPSMALAAVAAALLFAVIVPWMLKEAPSNLILSDTRWQTPVPESMTKGVELLTHPKRVALIILIQDGSGLSANDVAQLYERVNLPRTMGDQYTFLSPDRIKEALSVSPKPSDVVDASRLVLEKADSDYVLAFRIGGSGSRMNLAGFLFERAQQKPLGFASWDRVSRDRLSEIIALASTELLFGAEQP